MRLPTTVANHKVDAVFFDLDGTLADTAPDLAGALNRVRDEEGLNPLPPHMVRPVTSQGVRGLLRVGFGLVPGSDGYAELNARVLEHYAQNICTGTTLFPGMAPLLDALEARKIAWGVVTNKALRFTIPLMRALGLHQRAAAVVSGDSAPRAKPAPDPLLLAAALAKSDPQRCIYVGDDLRDIQAARAAGMFSVAVSYGYLGEDSPPETWNADALVSQPEAVLAIIDAQNARIET